jgi:hypothetical protein
MPTLFLPVRRIVVWNAIDFLAPQAPFCEVDSFMLSLPAKCNSGLKLNRYHLQARLRQPRLTDPARRDRQLAKRVRADSALTKHLRLESIGLLYIRTPVTLTLGHS